MNKYIKFSVTLALLFSALWFFWLSPSNSNSPLIFPLQTVDGDNSDFKKDIFGRIFFSHSSGHYSWGHSSNVLIKGIRSKDFKVLNYMIGKTDTEVYESGYSFMPSMYDAPSFEVLSDEFTYNDEGILTGGNPSYTVFRDKYNIYYFKTYKVADVVDVYKFEPVTGDFEVPKRASSDWYKDENNVYWRGVKVEYADPKTIEIIFDDNGSYTGQARDSSNIYNPNLGFGDIRNCNFTNGCKVDIRVSSDSI